MKRSTAFALIYQMLISGIVLLLVGAILLSSRGQVFSVRGELFSLRAQYAAEAGLQWVLAELAANPSWQGTLNQVLPGDTSSFSVTMVRPPASAGSLGSVNNLENSTAAASYLGAGTVPPHSALVVVVGEANGCRQELEAFVTGGGSWSQGVALLASGPIQLEQNVYVDGFKSLAGTQSVPGNVHSNQPSGADAIHWQGTAGGSSYTLNVTGTLSAVSADPQAISLVGSTTAVAKPDAAYRKLPEIDVPALVSRFNSPAGAPLVGGSVVLNGGTHYYSDPNLVVNGDVELRNGARLVVSGNLTINGSVSGEGAVLVDGDARLFGNSEVVASQTESISLVASGHVVLSGFDGTAYLNALAASEPVNNATPRGTEAAELWADVRTHVDWVRLWLANNPTPSLASWSDARVDSHLAVLGQGTSSWGPNTSSSTHVNDPDASFLGVAPLRNSTAALAAKVSGPGATQAFLRERFQHLDDLFRASGYGRSGDLGLSGSAKANHNLNDMLTYLGGTWDPVHSGGLLDLAQSAWFTINNGGGGYSSWSGSPVARLQSDFVPLMTRHLENLNYDRLGAARFRGLVYAHGGILVNHEVNVVGSMISAGDSSLAPLTMGGETLQPGEIRLEDGSRFTYVQDMFDDGVTSLINLGLLDVKSWRLRN